MSQNDNFDEHDECLARHRKEKKDLQGIANFTECTTAFDDVLMFKKIT